MVSYHACKNALSGGVLDWSNSDVQYNLQSNYEQFQNNFYATIEILFNLSAMIQWVPTSLNCIFVSSCAYKHVQRYVKHFGLRQEHDLIGSMLICELV